MSQQLYSEYHGISGAERRVSARPYMQLRTSNPHFTFSFLDLTRLIRTVVHRTAQYLHMQIVLTLSHHRLPSRKNNCLSCGSKEESPLYSASFLYVSHCVDGQN